jgi:hypothetical protein
MKIYDSAEKPHNIKVGDLYEMSWGYDQTNVNYFQVTRVSIKGVWVREIGAKSVPGTQGFMCESVVPNKDNFLSKSQWCGGYDSTNPETFRRVQFSNYNNQPVTYFNFQGRYFASPVKAGESTYNSWYA